MHFTSGLLSASIGIEVHVTDWWQERKTSFVQMATFGVDHIDEIGISWIQTLVDFLHTEIRPGRIQS